MTKVLLQNQKYVWEHLISLHKSDDADIHNICIHSEWWINDDNIDLMVVKGKSVIKSEEISNISNEKCLMFNIWHKLGSEKN